MKTGSPETFNAKYKWSWPDELAGALTTYTGRQEDREETENALYYLRACAENEKNNDYFRTLYAIIAEAAEKLTRSGLADYAVDLPF